MSGINDRAMFGVGQQIKPYTMLKNAALRDAALTLEARGFLAFMVSQPPGWKVNINWLRRQLRVGRDKIYRIINELVEAGYCIRIQGRDSSGAWQPIYYEFIDDKDAYQPQTKPLPDFQEAGQNKDVSPLPENPDTENPDTENQETLRKKERTNDLKYEKNNKSAQGARSGGGGDERKTKKGGSALPGMFDDESLAETDEGKAFRHYCDIAQRCGLKVVRVLTDQRRTAIKAVMSLWGVWPDGRGGWRKGEMGLNGLMMAMDAMERTPWMLGKNERGWKINLDTLLSSDRAVKLLEDFYGGDGAGAAGYPSAAKLAKEPRESWESRMRIWDKKNRAVWPTSWGPPPGRDGCGVPVDLLAKYGVKDAA